MSLLDKLKSLFSGGSSAGAPAHDHAGHDHTHEPAPPAEPSYTSTPEPAAPAEPEEGESERH